MSPALNGSSALQRFERSNAIEIRNGIMFDFCHHCAYKSPTVQDTYQLPHQLHNYQEMGTVLLLHALYHYVLHQLWAMFGTWLTHVHFMNMVRILGY